MVPRLIRLKHCSECFVSPQDRSEVDALAADKPLAVVGSAVTGEGFLPLLQSLDIALR
jgi:hypothetical protein